MFRDLGYEEVVNHFLALGLDKALFQQSEPASPHILSVKHIRAMVKLIQGEVFTREPTHNFSPSWRRRCGAVVANYRRRTSPVQGHRASVTELLGYQVEKPPAELPAANPLSTLPDPIQELDEVLAMVPDPAVPLVRTRLDPDLAVHASKMDEVSTILDELGDLSEAVETLPDPLPPPRQYAVGERRRQCEAIIRRYAMGVIAYRKRLFSTVILDERKLFADAHTLIYNLFGFETGIVADPHGGNQLQWLEENGYLNQFLDFLVHRRFPRSVSEIGQPAAQGGVG
jgi:hypothetical protein